MIEARRPEIAHLMPIAKRTPVLLVRGEGARAWDDQGKEYLDFLGGWGTNTLGHCHPVLVEALTQQARTLIQTSNQYYTEPQIKLAKLLVDNSCFHQVFFCNSGAEANEGAVKLARKYGKLYLNGAYEVITALNSFHGRTLAMVAATGQPHYQEPYTPMPAGFIHVEFDNIRALKAATGPQTCAVLLEPIQGEGGVNIPSPNYLKEVRAWCDERGILLIFDEIQTGMGRCGTLFGYQLFGVEPDIMTLAKGLAGGVPIGAILAKERASVFVPGDHGSTFGGNPLACAVGYAVLKYVIDNNLPDHNRRLGEYFLKRLADLKQKNPIITDVRGRGLLVAMEFSQDIAEEMVLTCMERGLLVNRVKPNTLRFIPPHIITEKEVDEAVDILGKTLPMVAT